MLTTMLKPGLLVSGVLALAGCGGSGGDAGSQPLPASETYSVTLTGIDVDRTADQQPFVLDGVPVDGATLTVE